MTIRARLSFGCAVAMLLGVAASTPVWAQGADNGSTSKGNRSWAGESHRRCDSNSDGKLTWDEYRICHDAWFARLDTQSQGKVKLDEVKAHARNPARAQAIFEQIDTTHAGFITREQYDAWLRTRFEALDTNQDGVLTLDEMQQGRQRRVPGGTGPGGNTGGQQQ